MLDTNSRYVYEVYRLKSVSGAANALFVSQPAISAAIRKVEKDLGAPIFNRKTLPFSLTPEGKIYIESIEQMLHIEARAAERIRNIREVSGGTLRIVTGSHISYRVIPRILRVFHQMYPLVDVNIRFYEHEKCLEQLEKDLADISVNSVAVTQEGLCSISLFSQKSVVALREDTQIPPELRPFALSREELILRTYPPEKVVTKLSLFRKIEFVHISTSPHISKRRATLFGKVDTTPHITSSTSRMQMNYNLMLAGFGALLATDAHIAALPSDSGCCYFVLGGPETGQDFSIAYHTRHQDPEFAPLHAFIDIAREFFVCDNPLLKIVES